MTIRAYPAPLVDTVMPPQSAFVALPASWYLLCRSEDIARGPFAVDVLGQRLVAWRRPSDGRVCVMDGRCAHMGAELGNGQVVADCIECPFHGWRYGADGRCAHIPSTDKIPSAARQRVFPAVERHGLVFFFNGEEALFALPFFEGEAPEDYVAAAPVSFTARTPWYMVTAHGFDSQHFNTVHGRALEAPIVVDQPHLLARRSTYMARVTGKEWYDRALKWVAGERVRISIGTWGGTLVAVTGDFARAHSRFMIVTQPLPNDETRCHVVVFARREGRAPAARLLTPLSLWVRRLFTRAYLVDEVAKLGPTRYNPLSLLEQDAELRAFFRWAAALPGTDGAPSRAPRVQAQHAARCEV